MIQNLLLGINCVVWSLILLTMLSKSPEYYNTPFFFVMNILSVVTIIIGLYYIINWKRRKLFLEEDLKNETN